MFTKFILLALASCTLAVAGGSYPPSWGPGTNPPPAPPAGPPSTSPPATGPPATGPPATGPPATGPPASGPPAGGPPAGGPPAGTPPATTSTTVSASAPTATSIPLSQCNTGKAQCCNSVQTASNNNTASLAGPLNILGVVLQGVDVLVGLGCTPITVIGIAGGANCAQQPVCCQNNQFNGLINIGCTPISL